MNSLFQAALEVQQFAETRNWPFCFIGGLAVLRWGEMRMTQDIDLCLLSGFGDEDRYIHELLATFGTRISEAENFARTNRVLLLSASNGIAVDVSLSGLSFEEQMIERATPFRYASDCSLLTCSAEDLIVLKAFADRAKDWMDVEGIINRQASHLDIHYISAHLAPFCEIKETPEIMNKLKPLITHAREIKTS